MLLPSDYNHHFIQIPVIAWNGTIGPQVPCNLTTKFQKPASNRFRRDVQTALSCLDGALRSRVYLILMRSFRVRSCLRPFVVVFDPLALMFVRLAVDPYHIIALFMRRQCLGLGSLCPLVSHHILHHPRFRAPVVTRPGILCSGSSARRLCVPVYWPLPRQRA